jgi:PAS domain S-box-containing protein
MVMVDRQGTILLVNALAEELFGFAREELLRQPVERLLPERFRRGHPKDRASFSLEPRRRPMGAGRDLYALRKDGTEVAVEIGLSPFETEDGLFILAAIADITERKHVEQRQGTLLAVTRAPAESTSLKDVAPQILQAVCENFDWDVGALSTVDRDAGVLRCVDVWHRPSVKVAEFEAVTREWTFAPGIGLIGRVWQSGEPAWISDVATDPNFPRAPFAARDGLHGGFAFPIRLGGDVHGVIEFFSQRIREPDRDLLAIMSSLGSQIGQFVARRRAEEERAQFLTLERAARREAETANRSKDEFLAMLSHELRTPLTAILGWTRMLRTGTVDEADVARALEVIERNTKVQTDLIEDLLDISRIESGKLSLDIRPVDLRSVVEAAIDAVRSAIDAKGIHLDSALDASVPPVAGDPARLQQIVWNLLSNAIKFTPQGGRITVRLERIDSRIQITVRDTGKGISPDFLPHVFDRFRQAASPRPSGGLGLGLTITRNIVQMHGGTVEPASPGEGQGATFTVTLPIMPVRLETRLAEESLATAQDVLGHPGVLSGVRVLVVDDEADARELLTLVLVPQGAEVRACSSAREALEILRSWRPEVLVSDIGMPDEDGYALIRKVWAIPREGGGQIPAIALTAYAKAADRSRAVLHGFQLHVAKPVEPAELAAAVANLAGRAGTR